MDQALGTAEPPASSGPEQRSSAAAAPGMPAAAADKAFKEPTPALIMRHCCCTLPLPCCYLCCPAHGSCSKLVAAAALPAAGLPSCACVTS